MPNASALILFDLDVLLDLQAASLRRARAQRVRRYAVIVQRRVEEDPREEIAGC